MAAGGCPLLELPQALLARILLKAAAWEPGPDYGVSILAKPLQLCRLDLELELLQLEPAPAAAPLAAPESVLLLRLVCRAFRRVVDEEMAFERLALNTAAEAGAAPSLPSGGDLDELEDEERPAAGAPGPRLEWLAGLPEATRAGVRALWLRLPPVPALGAAHMRALLADRAVAAGLEELDLRVAAQDVRRAPLRSLRLLAGLPSLRSLRVGLEVDAYVYEGIDISAEVHAAQAGLSALGGHPRLRELEVHMIPLPADALAALEPLPALRSLALSFASRSPGDVREVLAGLGRLTALERLSAELFVDSPITHEDEAEEDALAPLARLTALQSLRLGMCVNSVRFVRPLRRLRHLDLGFGFEVPLDGLAALAPTLESLSLCFEFSSPQRGCLANVVPRLTRLEALLIGAPPGFLASLGRVSLAPLARLRVLIVGWDPPENLVSRIASDLTALRVLKVRGRMMLREEEAAALRGRLRLLHVWASGGNRYTAERLASLRAALAGVRVVYGVSGVAQPEEDPFAGLEEIEEGGD